MHRGYDWVEESRKARLQEAWQLRHMGERFLSEARNLDPDGYPNTREGKLWAALEAIAEIDNVDPMNLHEAQIHRYSSKAISIAKQALNIIKG